MIPGDGETVTGECEAVNGEWEETSEPARGGGGGANGCWVCTNIGAAKAVA